MAGDGVGLARAILGRVAKNGPSGMAAAVVEIIA
jgi:hypothetical protein